MDGSDGAAAGVGMVVSLQDPIFVKARPSKEVLRAYDADEGGEGRSS